MKSTTNDDVLLDTRSYVEDYDSARKNKHGFLHPRSLCSQFLSIREIVEESDDKAGKEGEGEREERKENGYEDQRIK